MALPFLTEDLPFDWRLYQAKELRATAETVGIYEPDDDDRLQQEHMKRARRRAEKLKKANRKQAITDYVERHQKELGHLPFNEQREQAKILLQAEEKQHLAALHVWSPPRAQTSTTSSSSSGTATFNEYPPSKTFPRQHRQSVAPTENGWVKRKGASVGLDDSPDCLYDNTHYHLELEVDESMQVNDPTYLWLAYVFDTAFRTIKDPYAREQYLRKIGSLLLNYFNSDDYQTDQYKTDAFRRFCAQKLLEAGEAARLSWFHGFQKLKINFSTRVLDAMETGISLPSQKDKRGYNGDLCYISEEVDPEFTKSLGNSVMFRPAPGSASLPWTIFLGTRMNAIAAQLALFQPPEVYEEQPDNLFLHLMICWIIGRRALFPDRLACQIARLTQDDQMVDAPEQARTLLLGEKRDVAFDLGPMVTQMFPAYGYVEQPTTGRRSIFACFNVSKIEQLDTCKPYRRYIDSLLADPTSTSKRWFGLVYNDGVGPKANLFPKLAKKKCICSIELGTSSLPTTLHVLARGSQSALPLAYFMVPDSKRMDAYVKELQLAGTLAMRRSMENKLWFCKLVVGEKHAAQVASGLPQDSAAVAQVELQFESPAPEADDDQVQE